MVTYMKALHLDTRYKKLAFMSIKRQKFDINIETCRVLELFKKPGRALSIPHMIDALNINQSVLFPGAIPRMVDMRALSEGDQRSKHVFYEIGEMGFEILGRLKSYGFPHNANNEKLNDDIFSKYEPIIHECVSKLFCIKRKSTFNEISDYIEHSLMHTNNTDLLAKFESRPGNQYVIDREMPQSLDILEDLATSEHLDVTYMEIDDGLLAPFKVYSYGGLSSTIPRTNHTKKDTSLRFKLY